MNGHREGNSEEKEGGQMGGRGRIGRWWWRGRILSDLEKREKEEQSRAGRGYGVGTHYVCVVVCTVIWSTTSSTVD